jgi:hypothetical protein
VTKAEDSDDEEITSESESDEPKQSKEKVQQQKTAPKRKLTMEEIPEFLAKRQKDFQSYRFEFKCDAVYNYFLSTIRHLYAVGWIIF